MCVVSMVHDHYQPRFEPYFTPHIFRPLDPGPFPPAETTTVLDPFGVAKLIEDYRKAMDAAKTVDKLTAQPDCEDPTKATLIERVAALEKQVAELMRQIGVKPEA